MKNKWVVLLVAVLSFTGCTGRKTDDALIKLTGTWKNEFIRNGEKGIRLWTIRADSTLLMEEIGSGKLLGSVLSDLDSAKRYSFSMRPADLLFNLTDSSFATPKHEVLALITSESGQDTVFQWAMTSMEWKTKYWLAGPDTLLIWMGDQREVFVRVPDPATDAK